MSQPTQPPSAGPVTAPPPSASAPPPATSGSTSAPTRAGTAPRTPRAGRDLPAAIGVGALLLGLALVGLLWAPLVLALLVVALLLVGVWETSRALSSRGVPVPLIPLGIGAVIMPVGAYVGGVETLVLALMVTVLVILCWSTAQAKTARGETVMASVFTAVWVPFFLSFAVALLREPQGHLMVACMLLMVVSNDTFGYLVGVKWGKHPMAPKISPKKSWEGLAGSAAGAAVIGAFAVVLLLGQPWWIGALLGLLTVASATAGYCCESMVKRELNVKDMSAILPGHGGVMDRLDSLVFSAPVAYMVFALPFS